MKKPMMAMAAIAAASFSAPAQADVTNGGFETGNFSGWTQTGNTTFNGVQCPGPSAVVDSGNCSAFFGPIGSIGGIEQNVTTVAGQEYRILFSLMTDGGNPSSFSATFGTATLLSLTNPPASPMTDYAISALATSNSTTLSFQFRDDPGFAFLDSISVVPVPEPSTWMMMLLGFGTIGLAMRRRRRTGLALLA